ncbi:hypothetical protein LOTGIDRAFT_168899 [Lottia gigantea]|uniref:Phytanoyl-CoA hydroxylase-interacting protein-like C-terminal domain-containing protein n=1 Tax=Lottia gigantea TaxID=225164 RepID=V4B5S0_LOTGI|nr:hypothetical protein LOTGIDRAFT_168899 [Lottia gigantea]ESO83854.1 hypothetical protein LOTGIDRAFT_168899 [Lottia gigantea]
MAQKKVKIGRKEFDYNLPNNPDINRFIIKVHNETANQRSIYFFTKMEEWILMANDEDCVFMTIYGTRDNGEVLSKAYHKPATSGEIENLSRSMDSEILNKIDCEVKERVPLPNVSHPVFIPNASQERGTNFYVQILKHGNTEFIQLSTSVNNEIKDSTIELQSRRTYKCKLYKVDKHDEQCVLTASSTDLLKTRNCQRDVEKLMEKATSYIQGHSVYSVNYLYRNKPSCHPTILQSKKTGIIAKYLKDNNGDQYSSINNNICGLHFSATPANSSGDLPKGSIFGDYRIMIFPEYLVDGCHLYFADFFCMPRKKHWVTLVLTKAESEEDDFCQNRLVKLDIENNPFFYKVGASYKVTSLDVEILYTEDINLNEMRLKVGFQEKIPQLVKTE